MCKINNSVLLNSDAAGSWKHSILLNRLSQDSRQSELLPLLHQQFFFLRNVTVTSFSSLHKKKIKRIKISLLFVIANIVNLGNYEKKKL